MRSVLQKIFWNCGNMAKIRHSYERLRAPESLSADQVRARIRENRNKILKHCRSNIPFYASRFSEHNIQGVDDWNRIPTLKKHDIRKNYELLKDKNNSYKNVRLNTSGGSTGEPVSLLQDENYKALRLGMKFVYDSWSGYRFGDKKVILWGSERDILKGNDTFSVRLRRSLKNEIWLNAFRMDDALMRHAVDLINREKPTQILAYVEAISTLCKFIERNNLRVYSPTSVMTSAGTLFPEIRDLIERVFKAPVFNRYGSREVGDVACGLASENRLYVHPDIHYVEILREDGSCAAAGEAGRMVVTSFTNMVMPLVRYEIGDIGVMGVPNGEASLHFQCLAEVKGRVSDTIIGDNGAQVHGEYFTHLLYHKPWVEKFRFHQAENGKIDVIVQPAKGCSLDGLDSEMKEINAAISKVMGSEWPVEWKSVDEIAPHKNGKYRYVISGMKTDS